MADEPSPHDHHARARPFMVHRHRDVSGGAARAAVFGISDGLVSNVALILGVAAADASRASVLVAGVAGLLAGATSMAAGEYVSMKAQAELIERELEIERASLAGQPDAERRELAELYRLRGISPEHAEAMADAVMADPDVALEVHAREELGVDPGGIGRPVQAAISSFLAFAVGALIPLLPWFFGEGDAAIVWSAVLGVTASAVVGYVLSRFTERSPARTVARQVGWAVAACTVTWLIGSWLGTAIA